MSQTVTGYHAIEEFLRRPGGHGTLMLSRRGKRLDGLSHLAERAGVGVRRASDAELDRLVGHREHRGAVLVIEEEGTRAEPRLVDRVTAFPSEALVLLLDGVTDPHNLGAIIRSADQFAVDLLIIPERRSAHETETVARSSAGANVYVPVAVVPNLVGAVDLLKEHGFWVYAAEGGGEPAPKLDLTGRTAVVMGSEGSGVRRLVREHCDGAIGIEARGHVDSFNVSVAAGILLYECRRQQWMGKG